MNKLLEYKILSTKQRRQLLYKFIEIYLDDDLFLNSIEHLDDKTIWVVLDFIFSKDDKERDEKRLQLGKEFKLNLLKMKDIRKRLNNLRRGYDEFVEQNEEVKDLLNLESNFI